MNSAIKIKLIRTNNNLTQNQIANVLGISRSAYCGYEIGRRTMSTKMLKILAEFYKVPVNYFIDADESFLHDSEHYKKNEDSMNLSSLTDDERELIVKYRILSLAEKEKEQTLLEKKIKEVRAED